MTKPVAVNTGLALPRSLWYCNEACVILSLSTRCITKQFRLATDHFRGQDGAVGPLYESVFVCPDGVTFDLTWWVM